MPKSVVFPSRSAESTATTPSMKGSDRARSTTVLVAVVTRTPESAVTCDSGSRAEYR